MKTKLFFLTATLALVFAIPVRAQWQFLKTTHSVGSEKGYSITVDALGSIFTAGGFTDTIFSQSSFMLTAFGTNDGYITRNTNSGTMLWGNQIGGPGAEAAFFGMAINGTDLYAAGYFSDTIIIDTDTLTSVSGYDIFVVKFNALNGTVIWAKSYGGAGDQYFSAIAYSAVTNGVYLTGFSDSAFSFGSIQVPNVGDADIVIARLDTSGAVQWAISGGGNDFDFSTSISVDQFGNCIVSGGYYSMNATFGTLPALVNFGLADGCLIKCSATGTFMWAISIFSADEDNVNGVVTDAVGNNYVVGSFNTGTISFGQSITLTTNRTYTGYLAKYDSNGSCIFAKKVGEGKGGCQALALAPFGVVITGGFRDTSFFGSSTLISNNGSIDVFVTGFDVNGTYLWSIRAGAAGPDDVRSIAADANGNAYIIGYFRGISTTFGSFGDTNIDQSGNTFESYFAKLGMPTGIATANETMSLNVFPNPSTDHFTVSLSANQSCRIILTDMTGREVRSIVSDANAVSIECGDLPSGMYIISVFDENEMFVGNTKIIKQ